MGQHFLIDPEVYELMASLVDEVGEIGALEIGPGPGGLTHSLLEHGHQVVALELDAVLTHMVQTETQSYGQRIQVLRQDALETGWQRVVQTAGLLEPVAVVGNLPYYITGPLVAKLWEDPLKWTRVVFMLQKEVAERLATAPGNRATGGASVLLRYVGTPFLARVVPKDAFYPPPEVDSAVLVVDRLLSPPSVELDALRWWVRAGFQHRRKMLRQALSLAPGSRWDKAGWDRHLAEYGIAGTRRAESLTMDEWIRLAASMPRDLGER
ncbi:MAG: 16S rRNA (adenine(1518)-N(6)/adenine(1519)-N(6))-dimethyltransferase RsmA [Firmicutes bacterium]|nr:16S rRNA (adenine(1518)-N(6)/adenine(1519)-N(6))-dimethyltransferase RsmA [Bacillota bacterium]MCL5064232.1 16S rRNA (adenine(1518)-N(6)/adenine(1519)-N(6))-dimethyltransferase RsmA [Bacillota bacterium]